MRATLFLSAALALGVLACGALPSTANAFGRGGFRPPTAGYAARGFAPHYNFRSVTTVRSFGARGGFRPNYSRFAGRSVAGRSVMSRYTSRSLTTRRFMGTAGRSSMMGAHSGAGRRSTGTGNRTGGRVGGRTGAGSAGMGSRMANRSITTYRSFGTLRPYGFGGGLAHLTPYGIHFRHRRLGLPYYGGYLSGGGSVGGGAPVSTDSFGSPGVTGDASGGSAGVTGDSGS